MSRYVICYREPNQKREYGGVMKRVLWAAAWTFLLLYGFSPFLPRYIVVGDIRIRVGQLMQPVAEVIEPFTMPVSALIGTMFFLPSITLITLAGFDWTARDVAIELAY